MGGSPSKGTKADKRLKENKPKPSAPSGPAWSSQNKPPPTKKGGK